MYSGIRMRTVLPSVGLFLASHFFIAQINAQQLAAGTLPSVSSPAPVTAIAARLVKVGGTLKNGDAPAAAGLAGVTFSLYKDQTGGVPLWMETQNVQVDSQGNYTALLGSTKSDGLPSELFAGSESRWLGVQMQGQEEQPRVLLVSVPYALKAADADTLGGKPLSAFVLAEPDAASGAATTSASSTAKSAKAFINSAAVTGGTPGTIAKFDVDSTSLVNSVITENNGNIGIGVATPSFPFHVQSNPTGTSGNVTSFLGITTANPPADSSAAYLSSWYLAFTQGSHNFTGTVYGFSPQVYHQGTGTVSNVDTIGVWTENSSTGNILSARGLDVGGQNASSGTITNYTSLYVRNPLNQGILTNNYGLYLESQTGGSNNYAIYSLGGKNYFGGNVGIGTTTPSQPLEVAGTAKVTTLMFADNSTMTTAASGVSGVTSISAGTGLSASPSPITATGTLSFNTSFGDARYALKAGDTLTGTLNLPSNGLIAGTNQLALSGGNVGVGTASPSQKLEVAGNVKISGAGNGIVFADATTLASATAARTRAITYLAGCDTCSALADTDDQKTIYFNLIGPMTVNSVTCFADSGSPIINLQRNDGSPANILSSDLTCSTAGATSSSIVVGESVLNLNDQVDFVMVTAGGVAKRVTVIVKATVN